MTAKQIMWDAEHKGRIWLGGEMEFDVNQGPGVAWQQANLVAEACGYLAGLSGYRLTISGGDIPGYVVIDWFTPNAMKPGKVELWACEVAYDEDVRLGIGGGKVVTA